VARQLGVRREAGHFDDLVDDHPRWIVRSMPNVTLEATLHDDVSPPLDDLIDCTAYGGTGVSAI